MTRTFEDDIVAGLEEGLKVGVLEEQARVGGVLYRFSHAMFRQTLYEELSAARRIRLHQEVGRALEEVHARRLDDHASELAEHFSHSSDAADLAKAVQYGERGAQRAMGAHAYGEAIRLLDRTIEVQEVLDTDDERRLCDLLLMLGQALLPAGEPQRAYERVAPRAFAMADGLADRKRSVQAALLALDGIARSAAASAMRALGGREWAERADRFADPGTIERVYADLVMARVAGAANDPARRRELIRGALALAQLLHGTQAVLEAAYELLFTLTSPEEHAERLAAARSAIAMDRAGASVRSQVRTLWRAAYVLLEQGEREGFDAAFAEVDALIGRTPDAGVQLYPLFAVATRAILDGDLEAALEAARQVAARGEEVGSPMLGRTNAEWFELRPLLLLGRAERVLEERALLERARDLRGALALAHLGRIAEAGAALDRLFPGVVENQSTGRAGLVWLLETAVLLEDRERARVLAERLAPVADLVCAANEDATCIARHLGAAAHLAGDRAVALAFYNRALDACRRVRFRPEIALSRLALAELLLDEDLAGGVPSEQRQEEHAEALGHLDFAIEEFRAMKMQPSLERALRHKGLLHA